MLCLECDETTDRVDGTQRLPPQKQLSAERGPVEFPRSDPHTAIVPKMVSGLMDPSGSRIREGGCAGAVAPSRATCGMLRFPAGT